MIGIQEISGWVPSQVIDNSVQAQHFDRSADFVENRLGFSRLPRIANDQTTRDMAVLAFEGLASSFTKFVKEASSGLVVLVTQTPDGEGIPHTSPMICETLGLAPTIGAFDISLGCSGYPYAIDVVQSLVRERSLDFGLVFTADPYSKSINSSDHSTSLIFGDAATVTVIGSDPAYQQRDSLYYTDGSRGHFIKRLNGEIQMNGREVLRFTKTVVPQQIKDLLRRNNMSANEVDAFVLHQASRVVLDAISSEFPAQRERFYWGASEVGNTVSSSIPLALSDLLAKHPESPQRIICSGFGVGLSSVSSLLVKT